MNESRNVRSRSRRLKASPPFDSARLDALLDEAGMDAVVISSKHNIQYLFGGYRFFFFDHFDAIGVSRYLPFSSMSKAARTSRPISGTEWKLTRRTLGKFWTPAFQAVEHEPRFRAARRRSSSKARSER